MARELAARGWSPSLVLSSDSQRTRETWECMAPIFDEAPARVVFDAKLYLAGFSVIQTAISELDDDESGPVLMLGHNPGWETALEFYTGRSERMTTANAALLEASGKWGKLSAKPGAWELVELIRPKEI